MMKKVGALETIMLNFKFLDRLCGILRSFWDQDNEQERISCAQTGRHFVHSHFRPVAQPCESEQLGEIQKDRCLRLVAYVRSGHDSLASEQEKAIIDYCSRHNHTIVGLFGKSGNSAAARQQAFDALHDADGLITTDLMRLFCHDVDPARELKHQINEKFFHCGNHLIAINDHVDSATADGQARVIHFLDQLTDDARKPSEGLNNIEAVQLTARDTMYDTAQHRSLG